MKEHQRYVLQRVDLCKVLLQLSATVGVPRKMNESILSTVSLL